MLVRPAVLDPLLIMLLALFVDALVGDMRPVFALVPHPVAAFGRLIATLEKRLNRPQRSAADRRARGVVLVVFAMALAAAVGWLVLLFTRPARWGWAVEIVVAAIFVAQRSLYDHVLAVAQGLRDGGLPGGREAVRHVVGRDPESLDEHGVARAAVESLFENFGDGVVAPVFWYVIAGLPGLLAYKALNTLDSMIGHRNERYGDFGFAAARLDTAANFVPARLAGAIIAIAALFGPGTQPRAALRTMLRDAHKHRSFNAGWPEGAAAGALGLALAGPRRYDGRSVEDPWIGDGRARATTVDIHRALYLYVVACLVHAALLAVLAVVAMR